MVMLLFHVGEERYACDCDHIVEIVPKVTLKLVAHAPPYLAGLLRYNTLLVPVLEFCQLRDNRPCGNYFSTRIVLLRASEEDKASPLMGLMAEHITETIDQDPKDFTEHSMAYQSTSYLRGVLADDQGVIQLVDIAQLFAIVQSVFSKV